MRKIFSPHRSVPVIIYYGLLLLPNLERPICGSYPHLLPASVYSAQAVPMSLS